MRFGIPESDDDEEYVSEVEVYSSAYETDHEPDFSRERRSRLGESIRATFVESDSELDSEDEVGDLLDDGLGASENGKMAWREPRKPTTNSRAKLPPAPRRHSVSKPVFKPTPWWLREPSVGEILREEPSKYAAWIKETEADAWREGHRVAAERQAQLRAIDRSARDKLAAEQRAKRDNEAEEMRRMMEGLAVKHQKEEEDLARQFDERNKRIWADAEAAIKEAERRLAEQQAAVAAEERRRKQEEEARIAAEEKAAVARKAEAEREAKDKAEREAKAKADQERAASEQRAKDEAAKAEEDKRRAAAAEGSRAATEWAKWVEVQKRMKTEVIDVVKANREMRTGLRQAMRIITRSIGQVINTKETIVRVTNEINNFLVAQLPSPPSAAAPTTMDGPLPPAYGYLLSHLSKAFIKQAEQEVSAKADAAFPLARIALGLILRGHGAFAHVLYARLVKKCPWVVPHYPARLQNQPREEYEKSTGRLTDESIAEYIARMGGICTLYFAMLDMPLGSLVPTLPSAPPTPQQLATLIPPPFRLPAAWTWLACILRAPLPGLAPSAHLISVLLDTAGAEVVATYGRGQVGKLLAVVKQGLEGGVIKGDSAASKARLGLLLEGWEKTGALERTKGRMWE